MTTSAISSGVAMRIRDKVTAANEAVIQIRDLKAQIADRGTKAGDRALRPSQRLGASLGTVEEALYQVRNRSNQDPLNFPIKLNNKLAASATVAGDRRHEAERRSAQGVRGAIRELASSCRSSIGSFRRISRHSIGSSKPGSLRRSRSSLEPRRRRSCLASGREAFLAPALPHHPGVCSHGVVRHARDARHADHQQRERGHDFSRRADADDRLPAAGTYWVVAIGDSRAMTAARAWNPALVHEETGIPATVDAGDPRRTGKRKDRGGDSIFCSSCAPRRRTA